MTDIISVFPSDFSGEQVQAVSSKSLYDFLELNRSNYSKWIEKTIKSQGEDGVDYILGGVPQYESNEYILTIDFAKTVAMMSNSKKGKEVRQYFINVEKSFKKVVAAPKVPQTYLEALEAQVATLKQLETTGEKLLQAENKISLLSHSGKIYSATEIGKELGMKSANELNSRLEELGLQYKTNGTWVLRSWLSDKGYVSIKQMELDNGKVIYDRKWTQTGREFLLAKFSIKQ